jgi:hypothetical protein
VIPAWIFRGTRGFWKSEERGPRRKVGRGRDGREGRGGGRGGGDGTDTGTDTGTGTGTDTDTGTDTGTDTETDTGTGTGTEGPGLGCSAREKIVR